MKPTDFAILLTQYLSRYLPGQRNMSVHTIQSYRDTFTLLLRYCRDQQGWHPDRVTLGHLDRTCIESFLAWLEEGRGCSVATRNQRLAALHAFFRYVQYEAPEQMAPSQRILGIPFKKTPAPTVGYLTAEALRALLAQPDQTTVTGRRDAVLLTLLYDSAARVQELIDLVVRDLRLEAPAVVTLTGKGRKSRQVPLMAPTARLVAGYMQERGLLQPGCQDHPVFFNHRQQTLTRPGVTYILTKYVTQARTHTSAWFPPRVTPHVLRHTKAMHLVQANVNVVYIRDLLGHADVATTGIYARADAEMKRLALAQIPPIIAADDSNPGWDEDPSLMRWLGQVCNPQR